MTQIVAPHALKPPLKWAGGKRWLIPVLSPLWSRQSDRRYVEPFCGGLAIPLGVSPHHALLNDTNEHLIHFYRWLQRGLSLDIPLDNDRECYLAHRAEFNALIRSGSASSSRAAALFYYLNRTGYNGLCRFNRSGYYNVPFGSYRTIRYLDDFSPYRDALANWQFSSRDFQELDLDPDDFIYADPPYDVEFVQYSRFGFSWSDQVRLAHWLSNHRGPVVASNQATKRIVDLYTSLGFRIQYYRAPRRISCNGDRTPAQEILALKGFD